MDYDKLIRRLRNDADAYRNGKTLGRAFADQEDVLDNAATAIETLRADLARVTAERDAAQALLAERSGATGSDPITTAFGVPLDRLRELVEADRVGHCVVFDLHYPVVSEYYKDEDGRYIREVSGVVSETKYKAALKEREQE